MLKKTLVFIFMGIGLVSVSSHAATQPVFTTGAEWENRMSMKEKFMAVVTPMAVFNQYGVPFRHRPEQYIPAIDKLISINPQLEKEDISNILASTVYLFEPESRPYFDVIEMRFLKGDMELKPIRLLLS
jgi:hypothetical protein